MRWSRHALGECALGRKRGAAVSACQDRNATEGEDQAGQLHAERTRVRLFAEQPVLVGGPHEPQTIMAIPEIVPTPLEAHLLSVQMSTSQSRPSSAPWMSGTGTRLPA